MDAKQTRRLRWARETLRLSLREAGNLVGVTYGTVWGWEEGGGRKGGSLDVIEELCTRYMEIAEQKGLDPDQFRPEVLLPGEAVGENRGAELAAVKPEGDAA